ncbi:hypothetical protein [Nitratifractor sp.]|uniref:hypothetical protein n=1 Tax=Nitratifractor sp. TaxID=2268144 RepID=UPI0025D87F8F|nr:hypothetical protein [Nitratifractor sp.]
MRNEEPMALSAPLLGSAYGAVARSVAFGNVIGHWSLVIWDACGAFGRSSLVVRRLNRSAEEQRIPKSFIIHYSPFIIRKRSFQFLIPHSSFLIFAPKGAN